jgi:hypothetical protein
MDKYIICAAGEKHVSPTKMGFTKLCEIIAPQIIYYKAFMEFISAFLLSYIFTIL